MPPCAETVCDLVGKTFETTAVFNPDFASSSEARIPEPPPPIMSASNSFTFMLFVKILFIILLMMLIIIYHQFLYPYYIQN